jgi:hypothetical protein
MDFSRLISKLPSQPASCDCPTIAQDEEHKRFRQRLVAGRTEENLKKLYSASVFSCGEMYDWNVDMVLDSSSLQFLKVKGVVVLLDPSLPPKCGKASNDVVCRYETKETLQTLKPIFLSTGKLLLIQRRKKRCTKHGAVLSTSLGDISSYVLETSGEHLVEKLEESGNTDSNVRASALYTIEYLVKVVYRSFSDSLNLRFTKRDCLRMLIKYVESLSSADCTENESKTLFSLLSYAPRKYHLRSAIIYLFTKAVSNIVDEVCNLLSICEGSVLRFDCSFKLNSLSRTYDESNGFYKVENGACAGVTGASGIILRPLMLVEKENLDALTKLITPIIESRKRYFTGMELNACPVAISVDNYSFKMEKCLRKAFARFFPNLSVDNQVPEGTLIVGADFLHRAKNVIEEASINSPDFNSFSKDCLLIFFRFNLPPGLPCREQSNSELSETVNKKPNVVSNSGKISTSALNCLDFFIKNGRKITEQSRYAGNLVEYRKELSNLKVDSVEWLRFLALCPRYLSINESCAGLTIRYFHPSRGLVVRRNLLLKLTN